ncbi:uncharacterized protein with HEPN domain [Methanofollis sp. W23]|uniref:HepT-like ribonuclease domain-containing protein n=1 Tax=Methanofollis sp. W23 TaxID=2817849 RepID=UPI001AE66FEE|nr:hypothetical protein [Methanofollis sp. W23]MBP2146125.1 uncharacterized protein with HEPN domain [Methanofollis sp. W23]
MPPHEIRKYLYDVAAASELITTFVDGKTFDDYRNDPMLRSAVECQFENVEVVWGIVEKYLSPLRKQVAMMLDEGSS